jgi:pSer/pThr/pTyr-binding forkhead associated (FHA) protein
VPEPQPFKLIIEDDEGRRSIVPVDLGDVTLGRHEDNVIRLKERNVSRRHARLVAEQDGRIYAYDLDSYNGLWANGDRVAGRFELHEGDLLRIGDFQLELKGDGLTPRREETTQRTRVGEVAGQPPTDAPPDAPEPTAVDTPSPAGPSAATAALPRPMATEATAAQVSSPPQAPPPPQPAIQPLNQIMEEATALIRTAAPAQAEQAADTALSPPFAKLLCLTTAFAGQEFTLQQVETVLGRTDDNDIAIDHRSVSRHRAKIV